MTGALDPHAAPWAPPAGVTRLNGEPIPEDVHFPIGPPQEIGEVTLAESRIKRDGPGMSGTVRLGIAVALLLIVPAIFGYVAYVTGAASPNIPLVVGLGLLGAIGPVLWLLLGRDPGATTLFYVGKLGVAKIKPDAHGGIKNQKVFEFANAANLYTSETRQDYNGVYAGTRYTYDWKDPAEKTVFRLKGSYYNAKGKPKPKSPYWFAQAAEMEWTGLLLETMQAELEQEGRVVFKVNKNDSVAVRPGVLELTFKGTTTELPMDEIGTVQIGIGGGTFSIKSNDAKWFSGKGKFSFAYGHMANARAFLIVLEHLCGLSFE